MRTTALMIAAGFLALGLGPVPSGGTAQAAQATGELPRHSSQHPQRRTHVRVHARASAPPAQPGGFGWRPADPSFGPYYSLRRAQSEPGRCVEDLGYGRWRYCDFD